VTVFVLATVHNISRIDRIDRRLLPYKVLGIILDVLMASVIKYKWRVLVTHSLLRNIPNNRILQQGSKVQQQYKAQ